MERRYQRLVYFQILFWWLPSHLLLDAYVRGPSVVRRCAFDVSDFIPGVIRRRLRRYVLSATLFNSMVQTESQTFHQAVIVWKHLAHRNTISLLDITIDPFQLISVWTSDEDLTDYIKNHLEADRLSLVGTPSVALFGELTPSPVIRCRRRSQLPPLLLCDLNGVRHCLVSRPATILTPTQQNVLVDATGLALITDIGLTTGSQNLASMQNVSADYEHRMQWVAPEISSTPGAYSKEADVFSFAGIMIEVSYE